MKFTKSFTSYLGHLFLIICLCMVCSISVIAAGKGPVVTELQAVSVGADSIKLSWKPATGADEYIVYISDQPDKGFRDYGEPDDMDGCSFTFRNLTLGKRYYFKVLSLYKTSSVNYGNVTYVTMGTGDYSKVVSASPSLITVPAIKFASNKKKAKLYWPQMDAVSGYEIYRASSQAGPYTKVATINSAKTTSWTDVNTKVKKKYYYRIRTFKNVNNQIHYSGLSKVYSIKVSKKNTSAFVSGSKLQRYKSLKKNCSSSQFKKAYNEALKIVTPLIGLSRQEQLYRIAIAIRKIYDSGNVNYSMKAPHYSDVYGYFIRGAASCAGATRAVGLCLNMLGIKYEHVNENKWKHQWCRVKVGNEYWICDAFGLYVGKEPGVRKHPYM